MFNLKIKKIMKKIKNFRTINHQSIINQLSINHQSIIKILLFLTIICASNLAYSQLSVFNDGRVDMQSITPDQGRAVRSTVYNPSACSYTLTYNNNDIFYVCAQGWVKCNGVYLTSDKEKKKEIVDLTSSLEKVKKLKGVSYKFKQDSVIDTKGKVTYFDTNENDRTHLGFIAQDVENVVPEVVKEFPDGTKAIAYHEITALLVEAIKEQQNMIAELKARIDDLENNCCKKSSDTGDEKLKSATITNNNTTNGDETPVLYQNIPNPFNQNTTIKYYIPETATHAELIVYDQKGRQISKFDLPEKGNGSIQIEGNTLKAGTYLYKLSIDGVDTDARKMLNTTK